MIKEFSQSNDKVLVNFSTKFCQNETELLQSNGFNRVLKNYIQTLEKKQRVLYDHFRTVADMDSIETLIADVFKLLLVFDYEEVMKVNENAKQLLSYKSEFVEFVEGLYNYWRYLERYALIMTREETNGVGKVNFIESTDQFNNLILKTYRRIKENILGTSQRIYRQLAAGVNAGLVLSDSSWDLPIGYSCLEKIPFIDSIVLRPPFICYPKRNKRTGTYPETTKNPLVDIELDPNHWFCYPIYVGASLAYVYFHRDYMTQGVSLCNLFEIAKTDAGNKQKPDLVYVFGARGPKEGYSEFFHDKKNNIYVGIAYHGDEIDYFGYMKKMLLTLHNVRMIDQGKLPTHGSMVNIIMKDGTESNILIIGDSGAGKSESIEAFRTLSQKYLKEIKVIYDDMGCLAFDNDEVKGYGTETGAFVRLDDLDIGYAYNEMDRAIFMNPDKINSRVIIPAATYEDIMHGYKVDIILYANNFEKPTEEMVLFDNYKDAIDVFRKGQRKAKGTTSETGIVSSYFANPFGPVQRQEQTELLLEKYFKKLQDNKIPMGVIYTQLAVDGMTQDGPRKAAEKLFNWIKENK